MLEHQIPQIGGHPFLALEEGLHLTVSATEGPKETVLTQQLHAATDAVFGRIEARSQSVDAGRANAHGDEQIPLVPEELPLELVGDPDRSGRAMGHCGHCYMSLLNTRL